MHPKQKFERLVRGLRISNNTYLLDSTISTVLDYVESATSPEVVMLYTGLLEQICKEKGIVVKRILTPNK